MADWINIGPSLSIQDLSLYDKLNLPLCRESSQGQHFAACPYAGPIAIAFTNATPNSWTVNIYMQDGAQIASINASAIFRIFWSKCQKLILVSINGRVLLYDALGKLLGTFSMGDETLAMGVLDAKAFSYANETGVAVLNCAGHIFAVNSINTQVLWRIKDSQREQQPLTSWAVLANPIKPTQVLLCTGQKFYLGMQESITQPTNFSWAKRDGAYLRMEPNANGSQLILLHDSNIVQLVDANNELQLELCQIRLDQSSSANIDYLLWCGQLAFAISSKAESWNQLTLYSLDTDAIDGLTQNFTFTFSSSAHYFPELDGIRVFSRHSVHLLLPVSPPQKAVLGVGSTQPGAMLHSAATNLEQRSHVAYEFIRSISADQLSSAIDQCLSAAAHHFDPKMQKQLLKATHIGMRRCDRPYGSDSFVQVTRLLRVLNALRLMGIPLTYKQLDQLSMMSVIDRLIALGHWPMAVELCEFLELEPKNGVYKVLAHWCTAIMEAHKEKTPRAEERELANRMIDRLKQYPAISYADIAELAARHDLQTLATILLDMETNVTKQVTVMLKLKHLEKALQKAAQSQQPDLMHLVLRHLRNSVHGKEIDLLLRRVPQALSIYQSEIRDEAPDRLLALYEQNDDFIRQAIHYLHRADESRDFFDSSKTIEQLVLAEKALRNMRDTGNAQLIAESAQLIAENTKREEKYSTPMAYMSVRETYQWAAARGESALMEQLRKQHRLNEKQVFLWTVEGFAKGKRWQQLEEFVRQRKSPVGLLPFIESCANNGNKNLALRFMDRVTVYEDQIRAYLFLDEVKKAATLAAERADLQMLQHIRRRFPATSTQWTEVTKIMEDIARSSK